MLHATGVMAFDPTVDDNIAGGDEDVQAAAAALAGACGSVAATAANENFVPLTAFGLTFPILLPSGMESASSAPPGADPDVSLVALGSMTPAAATAATFPRIAFACETWPAASHASAPALYISAEGVFPICSS